MLLIVLLVLLVLVAFGGGWSYDGGAYRGPGFIIGLVLVAVLVYLLLGR